MSDKEENDGAAFDAAIYLARSALSLIRAHYERNEKLFLEKSRELASHLDDSGKAELASFIRAQTGDEPSWVPMDRKPRAAPGNAAALREAAERICSIDQSETQDLRQLAQFCHDQSIYGGGLIERVLADIEIVRQALSAPPEQPSNAAAMRAALSDACYAMFNFLKTQTGGYEEMAIALDKAKAALAAPPRNCDVGTPEEQAKRIAEYCKTQDNHTLNRCAQCPLYKFDGDCALVWAQEPYEPRKEVEHA